MSDVTWEYNGSRYKLEERRGDDACSCQGCDLMGACPAQAGETDECMHGDYIWKEVPKPSTRRTRLGALERRLADAIELTERMHRALLDLKKAIKQERENVHWK